MNVKRLLVVVCVFGLLTAGCGPAGEKEAEKILSGVAQTTIAGVTVVPETPVATMDVNVVVKQTFAAMTQQAGAPQTAATPTAPQVNTTANPTATSTDSTGNISGNLNYPSSSIPAMYVAAYHYGSESYKFVITMSGQNKFEIDGLEPGNYWVIAYTVGGNGFQPGLAGGYSKAVPCGLTASCTDHTLILVPVKAGQTTTGVDPFDWYAPQGTFPPFPQQGVFTTPSP